jgi:hypothetical protein
MIGQKRKAEKHGGMTKARIVVICVIRNINFGYGVQSWQSRSSQRFKGDETLVVGTLHLERLLSFHVCTMDSNHPRQQKTAHNTLCYCAPSG